MDLIIGREREYGIIHRGLVKYFVKKIIIVIIKKERVSI